MLMLANETDARNALALAQAHSAQCFIGRNNKRTNRRDYIVEYWIGQSALPAVHMTREDCQRYDPATLRIVDAAEQGWQLVASGIVLHWLDNKADAESALALAKRNTMHCFVGRQGTMPNYTVEYWR